MGEYCNIIGWTTLSVAPKQALSIGKRIGLDLILAPLNVCSVNPQGSLEPNNGKLGIEMCIPVVYKDQVQGMATVLYMR
jgi:hypothetical protein